MKTQKLVSYSQNKTYLPAMFILIVLQNPENNFKKLFLTGIFPPALPEINFTYGY